MMTRIDMESSPTGCWLWTGAKNPKGYGNIWSGERLESVHRVAYVLWVGPIPEGMEIDHMCRVRNCVNPAHLRPLTPADNRERNQNTDKTHCIDGHEFTVENTKIDPATGKRSCRACNNRRMREYRAKKRDTTT